MIQICKPTFRKEIMSNANQLHDFGEGGEMPVCRHCGIASGQNRFLRCADEQRLDITESVQLAIACLSAFGKVPDTVAEQHPAVAGAMRALWPFMTEQTRQRLDLPILPEGDASCGRSTEQVS